MTSSTLCKCGCKKQIVSPDKRGRLVSFLKGHNRRGVKLSKESIAKRQEKMDYSFTQTPEYKEKMSKIALEKNYGKWMVGKKLSDSEREYRSRVHKKAQAWRIGLKRNPETVKKMSESMIGKFSKEKHWNWRGGISNINNNPRRTAEYSEWRISVLKRDKFICQICFSKGKKLQVDHIKPWALYPELRFDINNGRVLCKDCHFKTPTYGVQKNSNSIKIKE